MMNTDNQNPSSRLALVAVIAALGLCATAGCGNDRGHEGGAIHGERFLADGAPRPVHRFADVQSATGARADGTLYACHFDGQAGLNSLGRRKLDLMLKGDAAAPLVVYLDVPRSVADDSSTSTAAPQAGAAANTGDPRAESVRLYLADRGLRGAQVELRDGPNLRSSQPARDGLRGLKRLQQPGQAEAGGNESTGSLPPGSANAGSSSMR